jgi:hypothetical protein
MYDQSLRQFKTYSKSAENITHICNGLCALEENYPYSKVMLRIMGMTVPPYRFDEV